MYALQKFFNYITLACAVLTVGSCIYCIIFHKRAFFCLILLILTLILNSISRVYNDRNMNLTKEDKEFLGINNKNKK